MAESTVNWFSMRKKYCSLTDKTWLISQIRWTGCLSLPSARTLPNACFVTSKFASYSAEIFSPYLYFVRSTNLHRTIDRVHEPNVSWSRTRIGSLLTCLACFLLFLSSDNHANFWTPRIAPIVEKIPYLTKKHAPYLAPKVQNFPYLYKTENFLP